MSSRIIGGTYADPQRYPYYCWMALFDVFCNFVGSCGCSLIHTDMLLSAAHCYADNRASIGSLAVYVNTKHDLQ
jgi:secreted trypsin-like serine protease